MRRCAEPLPSEYLPRALVLQSAPHHLTHPSGLVSSSLFFRFHSCPLAAKPRPRLVDHAPNDHYNFTRFKAGHSLLPILYHQDRLDQGPSLAPSPDSIFKPLLTTGPLVLLEFHAIFYQLFSGVPVYSCSFPSPRKYPLSNSRPAVRHDVHKRTQDSRRQTRPKARQHLASGSCVGPNTPQHKTSQTPVGD
jgi:hypothetical protein